MSETQGKTKREKILEEVRETPGKPASEIAESEGCSPAQVGRVIETNADERLREMRELRLKKHVDDMYDIERDILWIVAHRPDAGQTGIEGAYKDAADIGSIQGTHPKTGNDAPNSVGMLWQDCIDSDWKARKAVAGDLRDLLDEDRVSDAAKEVVERLHAKGIVEDVEEQRESQGLSDMQVDLLREMIKHPDESVRGLERRAGYSVGKNGGSGVKNLSKKDDRLRKRGEERVEAATGLLEKYGYDVPDTEGGDEEPECQYCGNTFENAAGLGKHEKHCSKNPENEGKRDTGGRKRDVKVADEKQELTLTNIETLETIVGREIEDLSNLASELDMSYQGVANRLHAIRKRGWRIASDALLEDAQRILDENEGEEDEPEVTVEHGGRSTQDVLAADESEQAESVVVKDAVSGRVDDRVTDKTEERRIASMPSDDAVDDVLGLDESLLWQLWSTGAAVAEIDGELVRLEVS